MEDLFANYTFGKVALKKIKPADPNFRLYCAGWLGDIATTDTMEVIGAVFREAKRGPRKGELCIVVPRTKRVAYVTVAEMDAYDRAAAQEATEQNGGNDERNV